MKLERLMTITILLLNRKRVQAQELAERLEVSLRTVYRDLETLGQAGIPIVSYTGMDGGYEIMESFRLDRQLLSFEELTALSTALRGLQSTRAYDQSPMDLLLGKVGAMVAQAEQGRIGVNEGERIQIDFTPWQNSKEARARYETLRQAVDERRLIRFTYTSRQGEKHEREVEPMALVLKSYSWYLQGYCRLREDYRIFKLSRIRELDVQLGRFERRTGSLPELNDKWRTPAARQEKLPVVLQFKTSAAVSVMDRFDEKDIERLTDGTIMVRMTCGNEQWLIRNLLHYRTDVIVVEPAGLAAKVRQAALDIAAQYACPPLTEGLVME
ncbi:YafY family protein [Paenibacillus sp. HB172176]|uniref:helix-turn-helix transcriptional regulator n=1 Tax=Paenibacillus sp. HB172176 TaxID=2493690 RepID=UPI00143B5FEB|nr:YafY family protein [Paenibacillus sp. HB172176]